MLNKDNKNKKIILFSSIIIVTSIALHFIFTLFHPQKKVIIGPKWVNQAQFAGLFTAKEKGYFSQKGIDVSFREFTSETNLIKNLVDKKTDFTITSAEEYIIARDEGKEVMAIAAFYNISPYVLISLKNSNIETVADFKGKTLGIKSNSIEEILVYSILLDAVGLTKEDVTIKFVGLEKSELDNLKEKEVDVIDLYRTDQLYFFDQNNIDYNIIYPEQYGSGIFNDVLVVRKELIENDPELVRDFVSASIEGWTEALKNTDDAINYTMKHTTSEFYKNRDHQAFILRESFPLIQPNSISKIGFMSNFNWEKVCLQMKNNGFIKNNFSSNDLFTNKFLP